MSVVDFRSPARLLSAALRRRVDVMRLTAFCAFCLLVGTCATFRKFGFDLDGEDATRSLYPYLADGWGLWYWLAQLHLEFNFFFLLVNVVLSAQIFFLAFPAAGATRRFSRLVSVVLLGYLVFWFQFGQARYGMALALLAAAVAANSLVALLVLGIIAFFVHKAAAGGIVLIAAWLLLRDKRHGVLVALAISAVIAFILYFESKNILLLVGYGNYLGWLELPSTNTVLKYGYFFAVLVVWKWYDRAASNSLLILTIIFAPFSYLVVFAGRSFQMYAVIFLTTLLTTEVPKYFRYLCLPVFMADVVMLVFASGYFF